VSERFLLDVKNEFAWIEGVAEDRRHPFLGGSRVQSDGGLLYASRA